MHVRLVGDGHSHEALGLAWSEFKPTNLDVYSGKPTNAITDYPHNGQQQYALQQQQQQQYGQQPQHNGPQQQYGQQQQHNGQQQQYGHNDQQQHNDQQRMHNMIGQERREGANGRPS